MKVAKKWDRLKTYNCHCKLPILSDKDKCVILNDLQQTAGGLFKSSPEKKQITFSETDHGFNFRT